VSNTSITYLIAAVAGVSAGALWVWLIAAPAWGSFAKVWERIVSLVLSLYVLVAMLVAGGAVGAAILYYYDEI
jgi:hypothetical protein